MFENTEIQIEDLPALEDVDWQPMHASLHKQVMLKSTLTLAIIAAIAIGVQLIPGVVFLPFWMLGIVLATIAVPVYLWPLISIPKLGFAMRKHDIAYKKGVFFHTVTTIPFDRIQHVETSRGPLDRRYGTSSLQLFTAGGSKGDLNIHGMDAEIAEHVRRFLLNQINDPND